ncbi:hypothetical protein O987_05285 [Comamonas testosteroni TK102]|uniref:Uncharacterized protein n=1 Tax=Comamonas testosteroni TK102 TaxID=1392005 RepID=A0A076PPB7_COMTE|nr:hypothetical protein O987_05285 [Comamonas testosteroni TK102]
MVGALAMLLRSTLTLCRLLTVGQPEHAGQDIRAA